MTSAFAAQVLPEGDRGLRQHSGADKIMYAGYYPMPDVPFGDHVWPLFLRENALRVFKLAGTA